MKYISKNENIRLLLELTNSQINQDDVKMLDVAIYSTSIANSIKKTMKDVDEFNYILLTSDELVKLDEGTIKYTIVVVNRLNNKIDNTVTTDYYLKDGEGEGGTDTGSTKVEYVEKAELENYYTKEDIDGKNYLTEHIDISGKLDKSVYDSEKLNFAKKSDIPNIDNLATKDEIINLQVKGDYVTKQELDEKKYLTQHQSISHKLDKVEANNIYQPKGEYLTSVPTGYAKETWVSAEINKAVTATTVDLTPYAKKVDMPTKVSELTNDKGYLVSHQDISMKADKKDVYTKQDIDSKGYLTEHQPLTGLAKATEIPTKLSQLVNDKGFLTTHQDLTHKLDEERYNFEKQSFALKSEIPTQTSDLINNSNFITSHQSLDNYATKVYVDDKVKDAVTAVTPDLSDYATTATTYTRNEIDSKGFITKHQDISGKLDKSVYNQDKTTFALKNELPNLTDYATKAYVKNEVNSNLELKANKTDLDGYVTNKQLNDRGYISTIPSYYVTEEGLRQKGYLTEIPSNYVTSAELDEKKYLTEVPIDYVKKNQLPTKVSELENDSKYLTTHQPLNHLLTKVDAAATYQPKGDYATKSWVECKGYLTSHQPLCDYATKVYVDDKVANATANIDLTEYAKQSWVNEQIDSKLVGSTVDLTSYAKKEDLNTKADKSELVNYVTDSELANKNYATESFVTTKIDEKLTGSTPSVDLTSYAKKEDLNTKLDIVTYNQDKPTFATKEELSGYLKEIPLEYVTDSELSTKGYLTSVDIANKADKSEIPSLEGYATETYVNNQIDNKLTGSTPSVDLKEYAKKTDLDAKLDIVTYNQDKPTFATKSELGTKVDTTAYTEDKSTFALKSELSNYQTAGDYVTNEVLNQKGYITEIPLEYVTETELTQKNYATKDELPSIVGLATVESVNLKADKTELDNKVDTTAYTADKSTFALKSELPSIEGLATTEQLGTKVDTTTYTQDKSTFALKSEISTKAEQSAVDLKADKTYVDGLIGGVNDKINQIKTMI